jgi:hypothetical protein
MENNVRVDRIKQLAAANTVRDLLLTYDWTPVEFDELLTLEAKVLQRVITKKV